MTAAELVAILARRGLEPVWTDNGLRLRGQPEDLTPALKRVMRIHREWLERQYRPQPPPPRPAILYWRLASRLVVLTSPPAKDVPYLCLGWSAEPLLPGRDEGWRELAELPHAWGFTKWW